MAIAQVTFDDTAVRRSLRRRLWARLDAEAAVRAKTFIYSDDPGFVPRHCPHWTGRNAQRIEAMLAKNREVGSVRFFTEYLDSGWPGFGGVAPGTGAFTKATAVAKR